MNLFNRLTSSKLQPLSLVSGFTGENGFCPEVLFNHILSWERKRTERSHRPFLLMLLDIQALIANSNGSGQALKDRIARALCDSTRDIDQCGWYIQDHVMGVIFSELNDQDIVQAQDLVWQRVQSGLCQALSPQELQQIDISLHVFPEGCDVGDTCQPSNKILYPDLHLERQLRSADLDDEAGRWTFWAALRP